MNVHRSFRAQLCVWAAVSSGAYKKRWDSTTQFYGEGKLREMGAEKDPAGWSRRLPPPPRGG